MSELHGIGTKREVEAPEGWGAGPSPDMALNEIVRRWPETVRVFQQYGMDACCGGALPLGEAARRHGVEVGEVVAALLLADRVS